MYEERDEENKTTVKLKKELEDISFRIKAIHDVTKIGIIDYHISNMSDYYVDENFAKILGYELGDLLNKVDFMTWYESQIHKDDKKIREQKIEEILLNKIESYKVELRILNKSQEYIWIQCYYIGVKDPNSSHVLRFIGTIRDITQEKKQEEDSKNKKEMLDALLGTNLNGIYIYDLKNNCNTYINEQFTKITGYTLNDLNKKDGNLLFELYHPDEVEIMKNHISKVKKLKSNEKTLNIKYRLKNKKGEYLTLISKDTILKFDENNKPLEMIGSFVDISEFTDESNSKQLDNMIDSMDIEEADDARK